MRSLKAALLLSLLASLMPTLKVGAQVPALPIELRANPVPYNYRGQSGVPFPTRQARLRGPTGERRLPLLQLPGSLERSFQLVASYPVAEIGTLRIPIWPTPRQTVFPRPTPCRAATSYFAAAPSARLMCCRESPSSLARSYRRPKLTKMGHRWLIFQPPSVRRTTGWPNRARATTTRTQPTTTVRMPRRFSPTRPGRFQWSGSRPSPPPRSLPAFRA